MLLFEGLCLFAKIVVPRINVITRSLLWAVPAQAPEAVCLPHKLPVFVGVWEPKVSQPLSRQSPPSPHTFQTASVATLHFVPRPMALADSQTPHKATAATEASVRLPAP